MNEENKEEIKEEEKTAETPQDPQDQEKAEEPAESEPQTEPEGTSGGEAAEPEAEETETKEEEKPAEGPDWKNMYARMRADFDNFRKRTERDREELARFASSDVLKDILPTVDNLARALEGAKDKKEDPFVVGVQLVYDGLVKTLADHGATPLDSMGEPFDANYHEALATLPSPDVPEGNVMNEVKRGWLLHGKLLRAAQVVVSSGIQE